MKKYDGKNKLEVKNKVGSKKKRLEVNRKVGSEKKSWK